MGSTSDQAAKPLDLNVIPLFQHKYHKTFFSFRRFFILIFSEATQPDLRRICMPTSNTQTHRMHALQEL